jgi:hypothetical protein
MIFPFQHKKTAAEQNISFLGNLHEYYFHLTPGTMKSARYYGKFDIRIDTIPDPPSPGPEEVCASAQADRSPWFSANWKHSP